MISFREHLLEFKGIQQVLEWRLFPFLNRRFVLLLNVLWVELADHRDLLFIAVKDVGGVDRIENPAAIFASKVVQDMRASRMFRGEFCQVIYLAMDGNPTIGLLVVLRDFGKWDDPAQETNKHEDQEPPDYCIIAQEHPS